MNAQHGRPRQVLVLALLLAGCPRASLPQSCLPSTLPQGTVGVPYNQTFTSSCCPYLDYDFVWIDCVGLPPGLSCNGYHNGLPLEITVQGTPQAAGTYCFRVTACYEDCTIWGCGYDPYCDCVDETPCITITSSCAPLQLGPTLPDGAEASDYDVQLTATGVPPHQFGLQSPLPPGLTLSAAGRLRGQLTTTGSWSFQVSVTDAQGCTGAGTFDLVVRTRTSFLAGRGLGQPSDPRVRAFAADTTALALDFLAYATGAWGANAVAADLVGGASDDIVTGPGPGAGLGPHARGFDRAGAALRGASWYAYATLAYGLNVTAGDVTGDGKEEVVTTPGPGPPFGPHVRGFTYDGTRIAPIAGLSFYAFGTLAYGANGAGADVDTDAFDELLIGPGPGLSFGATVRGFDVDGAPVRAIGGIDFAAFPVGYGVQVGAGDLDGDVVDEILAAPGAGLSNAARFRGFDYDGTSTAAIPAVDVTPYTTFYGGRAGSGDVSRDGRVDLLTGAGRDPAASARVHSFSLEWFGLYRFPASFDAFTGGYGVGVSSGALGY